MVSYFNLAGRTALITGASSGLGAHFARVLAAHGCKVALAARRADRLDALAAELRRAGSEALAVPMDVADPLSIRAGFALIEAEFGAADILVNNAGFAGAHGFLDAPREETAQVFSVNQSAVWDVAQEFCKQLAAAGKPGAVVNISSITGLHPVKGAASYAVAKAAVAHMTRIQALELAKHSIRVNAIAPGYFETELTREFLESEAGEMLRKRIPMRRTGNYEELDGCLLLLVSDRGSFMTGAVIPVDGGHLLTSL